HARRLVGTATVMGEAKGRELTRRSHLHLSSAVWCLQRLRTDGSAVCHVPEFDRFPTSLCEFPGISQTRLPVGNHSASRIKHDYDPMHREGQL
ncbi:hypothetical protein PMAYCL1PPCAC_04829, partial [Pristionchus mayeri]